MGKFNLWSLSNAMLNYQRVITRAYIGCFTPNKTNVIFSHGTAIEQFNLLGAQAPRISECWIARPTCLLHPHGFPKKWRVVEVSVIFWYPKMTSPINVVWNLWFCGSHNCCFSDSSKRLWKQSSKEKDISTTWFWDFWNTDVGRFFRDLWHWPKFKSPGMGWIRLDFMRFLDHHYQQNTSLQYTSILSPLLL